MALFNQKAYKEKVKFVKGEIEDLNNQIDNAAPLLNELKYIKSIKERNLKLLESMGDYESFSLKWHLIKSDIDLYKKLLKDEILCQRIKTAALLTANKKQLKDYQNELVFASILRKEELTILVKDLEQKINDEEAQIDRLLEEEQLIPLKDKEELKDDFLSKNSVLYDKYQISNETFIPNYQEAIYLMLQEKNKSDKLNSIIGLIQKKKSTQENLRINIKFKNVIKPEFLFNIENQGINLDMEDYNYEELCGLYYDINKKYESLKNGDERGLFIFSPIVLDFINSQNYDFDSASRIFKIVNKEIDPEDYNCFCILYKDYLHLNDKPIKTLKDKRKLKELKTSLTEILKEIIKNLQLLIDEYYHNLTNKIGLQYKIYPFTISNLSKKYDLISNKYNEEMKEYENIITLLNKCMGAFINERNAIKQNVNDSISQIEEEIGLDIESEEFIKLKQIDLFKIYDAVFMNLTRNEIDAEIEQSVNAKSVKKLTL